MTKEFKDIIYIKDNDKTLFYYIFSILYRRIIIIIAFLIISMLAAVIFISLAEPKYTSSASILIDPHQNIIFSDISSLNKYNNNNFIIDTEIEIIKSNKILEKRITLLNFLNNEEYKELSYLNNELLDKDIVKELRNNDKIKEFSENLSVERVGLTNILNIKYTSNSPFISQKYSNIAAKSYVDYKKEIQSSEARRNNDWFKKRIADIKNRVRELYKKISEYKEKHKIGDKSKVKISEQYLSNLKKRMIIENENLIDKKIKYNSLKDSIRKEGHNATIPSALNNSIISKMYDNYISARRRATELRKYGVQHLAYQKALTFVEDTSKIILLEKKRLLKKYENDYLAAQIKKKSVKNSIKKFNKSYFLFSKKRVKLEELRGEADTLNKHYKALLTNFRKSKEQETAPTSQAKLVKQATISFKVIWPKKKLIFILGLILGLGTGVMFAFFLEIWHRRDFFSSKQRTSLPKLLIEPPLQN